MNNLGNNLPVGSENLIAQAHAGSEGSLSQLEESILEELDIEEDDDSVDDANKAEESEKKKKKVDRARKQTHHSRHQSTKFINKEADVHDLTRNYIQTAADRKKKQVQKKIQNKFRDEYQQVLKENFDKELKNKYKDMVSVSSMVSAHKSQEQEKLKKDSEKLIHQNEKLKADDNTIQKVNKEKISAQTHGQQEKQKEFEKYTKQERMSAPKLEEMLKEYVLAFSDDLINETPEKKEQVRALREKLQSNGFNTKKMKHVEKQVHQHISSDLKKKLKNSFLEVALSYDKKAKSKDLIKNYQTYKTLLEYGEKSGILNAENFKIENMKEDSKKEVRDFLATELDRTLTETKLTTNDPKALIKEFDKFNEIASFSKFNPVEFLRDFTVKVNDMGLLEYEWPGQNGVVDTDTSTHSEGEKKDQDQAQQEDLSLEEKLEKAEDKLRKLYIRQYTKSGLFEAGKLALDIFNIESKVKALHGSEYLEKIQKEARGIAKLKLVIMLRESYEERAVLSQFKGPEFENLDKRFKMIINGLKKADLYISKNYLKDIRDQANKAMFTIVKEELTKVELHLGYNSKNTTLLSKKEKYKTLLYRIKEETRILESVKTKFMEDLNFLSDLNIIEAA